MAKAPVYKTRDARSSYSPYEAAFGEALRGPGRPVGAEVLVLGPLKAASNKAKERALQALKAEYQDEYEEMARQEYAYLVSVEPFKSQLAEAEQERVGRAAARRRERLKAQLAALEDES